MTHLPTAGEPRPRIGGIALRNGLVLVSERYWAAAIRKADGSIESASGRKIRLPGSGPTYWETRQSWGSGADGRQIDAAAGAGTGAGSAAGPPVVRGLARFGESLAVLGLVKLRLPEAELPLEGRRVAAALALSLAATSAVRVAAPRSAVVQEVGAALAALVPALWALKGSPILAYHGAEHKVIGAREAAVRRTGKASDAGPVSDLGDAAEAAREHDRCGTNLIGPYLAATVVTNLLARGLSKRRLRVLSAAASAASLGLALEALRWATEHADSLVARLLLTPGRLVQRYFTTVEPTPEQLEVGRRALRELLRLEYAGE